MKITHSFHKHILTKETDGNVGFLLSNKAGDYVSLFNVPLSRYGGWFARFNQNLFKIIENIEAIGKKEIKELKNGFCRTETKISLDNKTIGESFFLPDSHSLIYELSDTCPIELTLDFKAAYDNGEGERFYEITESGKNIVIRCQNKKETVFLAIKPDYFDYEKTERWLPRFYGLDKTRNSPPFVRYVFQPLRIKAKTIVFSVAKTKEAAIKEAEKVFRNREVLKKQKERELKKFVTPKLSRIKNEEVKTAYLCATNSLLGLLILQQKEKGIAAGLPWFFQLWSRDEAISAKALFNFMPQEIKKILLSRLSFIKKDGTLPNIFGQKGPDNADAAGWLFKILGELAEKGSIFLKKSLEKTIDGLLKYHTKDELAISQGKNTWMDTIERPGACVEIQALRLNMYKLAYQLTKNPFYKNLENKLRQKVRKEFWNGKILADGLGDFTSRPNVFLAAYIYPELLKKEDWMRCFENALEKLWLDWGGIATLGKNSPYFVKQHTGENPFSYHQGDSWFYLNNLTALVLYKFAKKKFLPYIKKILQASTQEILWQGIIGHHSELSSASELKSEGCWSQVWSSALYIELINEIFGKLTIE